MAIHESTQEDIRLEQAVEDFKRDNIQPYCLSSCSGVCCKFGGEEGVNKRTGKKEVYSLEVKNEELRAIVESELKASWWKRFKMKRRLGVEFLSAYDDDIFEEIKKAMIWDGRIWASDSNDMYLSPRDHRFDIVSTCPAYDEHTRICRIHEGEQRLRGCKEFPLDYTFFRGVSMNERCPYVRDNRNAIIAYFEPYFSQDKPLTEPKFMVRQVNDKVFFLPRDAHENEERQLEEVNQIKLALGGRAIEL